MSITGDEFTIIREGSTEKLALALATAETNDSGDIPNLIDCTLDHVLEMRSEKCHMDQTLIDAYKLLKNKK